MNKPVVENLVPPSRSDAYSAAEVVRQWLTRQNKPITRELQNLGLLSSVGEVRSSDNLGRKFDNEFLADPTYIQSLPDLQNGPSSSVIGAKRRIEHVGISNFRLPLRIRRRSGGIERLESSVSGTVSLDAEKRGINMSRIIRSFYRHAEKTFSFEVITDALKDYELDLASTHARIQLAFSYPMKVKSLRSGLWGYQYYRVALEQFSRPGLSRRIIHLDYVYSSTCPCSLELSEHARHTRKQLATPHSQRSVARISVALTKDMPELWFEDLIEHCRDAVPTETQVMVKREDEQAFAELNAANPIFVEDAARLFSEKLNADPRVEDFRVVASHQESLHSHDAVSVITEGHLFETDSIDPSLFRSMYQTG